MTRFDVPLLADREMVVAAAREVGRREAGVVAVAVAIVVQIH
jgi:hypothetical protein